MEGKTRFNVPPPHSRYSPSDHVKTDAWASTVIVTTGMNIPSAGCKGVWYVISLSCDRAWTGDWLIYPITITWEKAT